eukprot:Blabericola_migrator_1__11665@NODE_702_length_6801_cov_173_706861_g508_i1_p2_GENE_NODE_702_length_6801_cov_173_706861_g508_i1NODE_702_length_6801_cov_173_706861_g508_i1_p2_ORF_typecomplete_len519_score71_57ABC2_membrane/PF01061_24/2_9e03ABC2_membrane/PF01061_24/3_6e19ABC2_membrane_3/PF12698_7/0_00031_NODE_702_length_6801_cov_173_706861_g508_i150526608
MSSRIFSMRSQLSLNNHLIYIVIPLAMLGAGILLGCLFRGSLNRPTSRATPIFLPSDVADSNTARTLEQLTAERVLDAILQEGIKGDRSRQDPLEKLLSWPTSYRWLYRTVHTWIDKQGIHKSGLYPDFGVSLSARNESFVNDYHDLGYLLDDTNEEDLERFDTTGLDSDLPWASLNFFTPRFMITELNGVLQMAHYSYYSQSWEAFQSCFTRDKKQTALIFYPCLSNIGFPTIYNYINATGLPLTAPTQRHSTNDRRLFLEIREDLTFFKTLKDISDAIAQTSWGAAFYDETLISIRTVTYSMSVMSALFFLGAGLGFVGLELIQYFFLLRIGVNRDTANKHYGRLAFYIGLNLASMPLEILNTFTMAVPATLLTGFEASILIPVWLIGCLFVSVMSSVHRLICIVSPTPHLAMKLVPPVIIFMIVFSGFFIRTADIPGAVRFAKYLSPYRWAVFAMGLVAFPPQQYTGRIPNQITYGANGIEEHSLGMCVAILWCQWIGFRLIGAVAFCFLHTKTS